MSKKKPPKENLKKGMYVLATKWSDGDPCDQWCVGFYYGIGPRNRHYVVDSEGKQFRHNGFRKVSKVTTKRGCFLVNNIKYIDSSSRSLWWWKRCSMVKNDFSARAPK